MKKSLFILLPLLFVGKIYAAERTVEQAALLATQFRSAQPTVRHANNRTHASVPQLAQQVNKIQSDEPAYFVFNHAENDGFTIVSGDDLTQDILLYSNQGSFDANNINPNMQFWLDRMQEEISVINTENAMPKGHTAVTPILPLLGDIAWGQETPFWNLCPMDRWNTTERCYTGCVATGIAQIMFKWRYPVHGVGSHSYMWYCCTDMDCITYVSQQMSQDFSSVTFEWDSMLNVYYKKNYTVNQANAVAELMYCCGIACDMQYGGKTIGGSGSWTDDMGCALKNYFGYRVEKFISTYTKTDYESYLGKGMPCTMTDAEWNVSPADFETYFNAELEAGRPILVGGETADRMGHEFVCDGRDASGKFHINWGWDGSSNCYVTLSVLAPTGTSYDFSHNIDALLGVQPALPTDCDEIATKNVNTTDKYLHNGNLVIERNKVLYSIMGTRLTQ